MATVSVPLGSLLTGAAVVTEAVGEHTTDDAAFALNGAQVAWAALDLPVAAALVTGLATAIAAARRPTVPSPDGLLT